MSDSPAPSAAFQDELEETTRSKKRRRRSDASSPLKRNEAVLAGLLRIIRDSTEGVSVRSIVKKAREEHVASSPNLIIRILNKMHDDGIIEPTFAKIGRGPPRKIYRPSQQIAPTGHLKDEFIELLESDKLLQYFPKDMSAELWKRLVIKIGKFISIGEKPASKIAEQTYVISKKYWEEFRNDIIKDTLRSFFQFIATLAIFQEAGSGRGRKAAIRAYYNLFPRDFGHDCEDAFRTAVDAILLNFFPHVVSAELSDIDRKIVQDIIKEMGKPGGYDLNEAVKQRRTKLLLEHVAKKNGQDQSST